MLYHGDSFPQETTGSKPNKRSADHNHTAKCQGVCAGFLNDFDRNFG